MILSAIGAKNGHPRGILNQIVRLVRRPSHLPIDSLMKFAIETVRHLKTTSEVQQEESHRAMIFDRTRQPVTWTYEAYLDRHPGAAHCRLVTQ